MEMSEEDQKRFAAEVFHRVKEEEIEGPFGHKIGCTCEPCKYLRLLYDEESRSV